MIDAETVWSDIWPVVEKLVKASLMEDDAALKNILAPGGQAADAADMYGIPILDILLKAVLGRPQLGLIRAVETENGRFVHVEYAWPDPESEGNQFTAADVVTVTLEQFGGKWQVLDINPAMLDTPLTSIRARAIIDAQHEMVKEDEMPTEPWLLPVAFYAGMLQISPRPSAMEDAVEQLLLPGLQKRAFGMMQQIYGRRLWRDFKAVAEASLDKPNCWAAAVEFIMSGQEQREVTQAAVGKHYQTGLTGVAPRVRQIKTALNIQDLDERYTDLQTTQIILKEDEA